jgi:cytochrome c peroxidase
MLGLALGCAPLGGRNVEVPTTPPRLDPDLVQRGAMLFLDARVSGDGSRSCADCHPGGGSDYEVHGGRLTPTLRGLWQTAPYLWDGSAPTLDEALARMLATEMAGGALSDPDRAALLAYLRSLAPFDRGRIQPDGAPVEPATLSVRRGAAVFVKAECSECHPAPAFTRPDLEDVGTGGEFNAPTLRGVSVAKRFGHDGRWTDLEVVIDAMLAAREVELTADERAWLLSYLKLF